MIMIFLLPYLPGLVIAPLVGFLCIGFVLVWIIMVRVGLVSILVGLVPQTRKKPRLTKAPQSSVYLHMKMIDGARSFSLSARDL